MTSTIQTSGSKHIISDLGDEADTFLTQQRQNTLDAASNAKDDIINPIGQQLHLISPNGGKQSFHSKKKREPLKPIRNFGKSFGKALGSPFRMVGKAFSHEKLEVGKEELLEMEGPPQQPATGK